MSFETVSDALKEAERKAVAGGVPAARAAEILIRAETDLLNAMLSSQRAERQLLLDLKNKGASQVAKERGRSRRWVYNQRDKALNKVCNLAISRFTPSPI